MHDMPDIAYRNNIRISVGDFADVLKRSTLAERRPVDNTARLQRMLDHANVIVTAWAGEQLIGISRAITDFAVISLILRWMKNFSTGELVSN